MILGVTLASAAMAMPPSGFRLGSLCGCGTFGKVYWAEHPDFGACVAKRASISSNPQQPDGEPRARALRAERSAEYLAVEADINSLLVKRLPDEYAEQRHVAPYLGKMDNYLVWRACGMDTMESYLKLGTEGLGPLEIGRAHV